MIHIIYYGEKSRSRLLQRQKIVFQTHPKGLSFVQRIPRKFSICKAVSPLSQLRNVFLDVA